MAGWKSVDFVVEVNRSGFKRRGDWNTVLTTASHGEAIAKAEAMLAEADAAKQEIEIVISTEVSLNM